MVKQKASGIPLLMLTLLYIATREVWLMVKQKATGIPLLMLTLMYIATREV